MTETGKRDTPAWLPAELTSIAYELARVDQLVWQMFETLLEFSRIDVVDVEVDDSDGVNRRAYVKAIADSPPIVALLFGEAINHLRSALEHTLFGLIELRQGRPLTNDAAKKVSFPASPDIQAFDEWTRKVRLVPGLSAGAPLYERVKCLQPFMDTATTVATHNGMIGPSQYDHPLTLLHAYSNIDKHRRVHTASAQDLGINSGLPDPSGLPVDFPPPGPYEVGQLLVTQPIMQPSIIEFRPAVMVERPTATGGWAPPARELNQLHRYIAEFAVPTLVTGLAGPGLVPQLDLGPVAIGRKRVLGREYAFERTLPATTERLIETQSEYRVATRRDDGSGTMTTEPDSH